MKRFIKFLTANSAGILINLCAQIFSIPLFLHLWSKELYGEWLVLTAVPNLLWSLEGGLGVLAANRMTLAAAVKDWKAANEIFQTTLLCQILLSALLFGATLTFALLAPVASFFGFHKTTNADASFILVVMISYMLLGLMMSVYRAAYRTSEMETRGAMLLNLWRTTDLIIILVVLSFKGNPVQLAESLFTGILVWTVLGYVDVRRQCQRVIFGFREISWMRLREMVVHGLPLLIGQATVALYMQGFPLVVNRSLGAAAVVTLTTLRTLSRLGLLMVQTIAYSSSPQLSRSCGAQDWPLFGRLVKLMAAASIWSGLAVTVGLTALGPWIIAKWTGNRLSVDHTTICLFALSVSFQGIWTCCAVTLSACNRHHLFNYGYFLITVISLTVALFLAKPFGFNVVPITMLVADIFITLLGLYFCKLKIPQFPLGQLWCVFQISFYKAMILKVVNHRNISMRVGA